MMDMQDCGKDHLAGSSSSILWIQFMALLTEIPFRPCTSDLRDFSNKIVKIGNSMWRGLKVRIIYLASDGNKNLDNFDQKMEKELNLTVLAKATKRAIAHLGQSCLTGADYMKLSATQFWHQFLLKRQISPLRQNARTWIQLSPNGCLLSAAIAASITIFAIATLSESYKKRWVGYAGITCTAIAIAYIA